MEGTEKVHIVFSDFRRGVEISLTKRWSSTASPVLCERNLEPESFQQRDRGNSDVWFVVTHKRVVPKNDGVSLLSQRPMNAVVAAGGDRGGVAGFGDPGYSTFRKPLIESFACIMGQGTSRGYSNRFLHRDTDGPVIENSVCQRRHETSDLA